MEKINHNSDAIYDASTLGIPKKMVLGFQHLFAMFGATVLVPALTGLSVSATLLFAGLGTLLFHLISKGKVPAFLGSSFAFLIGYRTIAPEGDKGLLPYACLGVACAGVMYLLLAALIKAFGVKRVIKFFPPIVTGPIIIAIGLSLSTTAISSCQANWILAILAIAVVIICNIWGKGMIKIIPIMLGVVVSYSVAVLLLFVISSKVGDVGDYAINGNGNLLLFSTSSLDAIKNASWVGLPFKWSDTVFSIFKGFDSKLAFNAIITIVPIALATMVEHIGDISAISSTVGKNYISNPGLHRTLTGDGLATILASLFGAPANTTYGENTGVLSLSKVFDAKVVRLAAYFAVALSFSPKFAAIIGAMPLAVGGGVSLVLYGMISAVGVRNMVENKVDFGKSRNIIIAAMILVLSVGINYGPKSIDFSIGKITISLSGLAAGAIVGIILNAILPGKDYEFDSEVDL